MKLIIADDHDLVRDALALLVQQSEPDSEVLLAEDYDDARSLLQENPDCDLVILDVYMPGMNGLDGLSRTVKEFPEIPVVMMSGSVTEDSVQAAFDKGASGFIPKTLSGRALVSILNLVASGVRYVPDLVLTRRAAPTKPPFDLSPREHETLQQLAHGYSNKVIAKALGIEETTVKLHLRSLFRKLGVSNRTEAVVVARDCGLVESGT